MRINLQFFGGRGASSSGGALVSFQRSSSFDQALFNKLPKKNQVKNITDIGKEKHADGTRYFAVLKWEDGFERLISEYTLSDFKYYVDQVLNHDRKTEF